VTWQIETGHGSVATGITMIVEQGGVFWSDCFVDY
jgi:hypothetical protein